MTRRHSRPNTRRQVLPPVTSIAVELDAGQAGSIRWNTRRGSGRGWSPSRLMSEIRRRSWLQGPCERVQCLRCVPCRVTLVHTWTFAGQASEKEAEGSMNQRMWQEAASLDLPELNSTNVNYFILLIIHFDNSNLVAKILSIFILNQN